jgi:asparagine synthase (glutamine-hydrolysing)
MCGISGLFSAEGCVAGPAFAASVTALRHRGPDDQGSWQDRYCALGQTRLAIIDLAGGHQPLVGPQQQHVLVVNGEIYNFVELRQDLERQGHHFATQSDSETILHAYRAYGTKLFPHLNGMFAFALYDRGERQLLLARDRLGIKPLFYAEHRGAILFASEVKALLTLLGFTPELNPSALLQYLQNQFTTGRETIFRGIFRLLPGEFLQASTEGIQLKRYWSATTVTTNSLSLSEAQESLDALMAQVMREHMRSDVPYGLFLSGGVDSGCLLAKLSEYRRAPVRSFSVGFPNSSVTDELPLARAYAQQFGANHQEHAPSARQLLDSLPLSIWATDELMRDAASLPTLQLSEFASRELKVVFSGEGGDEVFAGYGRYRVPRLERWLKACLWPGSRGFRSHGLMRGKALRQLLGDQLYALRDQARQPFIEAWRAAPRDWSDLQRMQYVDLTTALADNLLVKADRLMMCFGLEGRVPLLDHRIVEFGLSLPDRLKVDNKQGKYLLKKWASGFLSKHALFARKRGFNVPLRAGLSRKELQRIAYQLPKQGCMRHWFHAQTVSNWLERDRQAGVLSRVGLALLQFAIWHRLFVDGDGQRPPDQLDPLELVET